MKDATSLTEADAYRIVIRDLLWLLDHSASRGGLVPCTCAVCERLRLTYAIDPANPYDSFRCQTLLPAGHRETAP